MALVFPRREAEAQSFLDANPDIESVQVVWTDLCGVARGKVLRRDEVAPAWKDGRFLPISALVGTRDLGQQVYVALSNADAGIGLVAGIAITLVAMISDRIIQTAAAKRPAVSGPSSH